MKRLAPAAVYLLAALLVALVWWGPELYTLIHGGPPQ